MSRPTLAWRAARNAGLITAAALLLVLSRSEIRKTLLIRPAAIPALAALVWLAAFLIIRLSARRR